MNLGELIEALSERRAWRWLIAYAAASWGLTEATGFAIDNYGLSRTLLDVLVFLILVFLPILLTIVWFHGAKGNQRVTRAEGIIIGALLAVGLIGSVVIATRPATRGAVALAAAEPAVDLGEGSVAVLPFNTSIEGGNLGWLDRGLAELLTTHLAQLDGLKVVAAQRISDLMRQHGMGELRQVPVGLEPRVTRLAGARMMVTGSVYGRPEALAITATLADAATGEILASANARGSDVFAMVDSISLAMSRQITGAPVEPTELASAAQLTTTNVDAYREYQAGREALALFHYREAEGHFRRAVDLDSTFALAHFRLGMALFNLGTPTEAAQHIQFARENLAAVSERDSLFIEAVWGAGLDPEGSARTFRELLRKYPDEKDARIIFAGILGDRVEARASRELRTLLEETIRLDPSHAAAYNQLAYASAGAGDFEAADSLIRRYVELEPEEPNPRDSRGEILEYAGRHADARAAYREALRLRPDFTVSLEHLARSYLVEDKPAESRAELAQYVDSPIPAVRVLAGVLTGDTHVWEGAVADGLAAYERADLEAVAANRTDLRSLPLNELIRTNVTLERYEAAGAVEAVLRELEPINDWWITLRLTPLLAAGDIDGLERLKAEIVERFMDDPLRRPVAEIVPHLADMWIAYARDDHRRVVELFETLPPPFGERNLPGFEVIESMLALGQAERALRILEQQASPDIHVRGARFIPLPYRQGQYLAARGYEMIGDTATAIAVYGDLVQGFGDAVEQIPLMADAPDRLEALRTAARGS